MSSHGKVSNYPNFKIISSKQILQEITNRKRGMSQYNEFNTFIKQNGYYIYEF